MIKKSFWQSRFLKAIHVDLDWHPLTYFTCGEAIEEVGHLELIFTFYWHLSVLKKTMVWGEDKLKRSAQANSERNRQRFEWKKNRPVPIWRRTLANWRQALTCESSYFEKIAQLSVA